MKCPHCHALDSLAVTDSRPRPDGTTYRRRACAACGVRVSTVERHEPAAVAGRHPGRPTRSIARHRHIAAYASRWDARIAAARQRAPNA